ncbi:MAG TPA: SDR family oxidoreductase [Chloroflexota bacterium]|jgi:3-oxoacyl-[acyl-carrier protein] reductase
MSLDVRGRVALITGGGTGMGCAIAEALAERGADVALGYARSRDDAESTAERLRGLHVNATTHKADVARVAECDALVQDVIKEHGRLDILVNGAGTTHFIDYADLQAVTEEVWDEIFDVNLKGAFFVARAAGLWMREHGDGRAVIVNIASVSAFAPRGSSIPYSVSKSALVHATKGLATALAPSVRVNAVAPGLVLTRWWTRRGEDEIARQIAATRFKRDVSVEDVVDAALLLVQNESMSGQTIAIDAANIMH